MPSIHGCEHADRTEGTLVIIDSHTHIDEAGFWVDPPEAILRLMDEAGIDRARAAIETGAARAKLDQVLAFTQSLRA